MTGAADSVDLGHNTPRNGMLAVVRNRRGIISNVRQFDANEAGRYHLVQIDYKDEHLPTNEELVWELEPVRQVLQPNDLPSIKSEPMLPADFDALVRAARWTAISPYLDPDESGPLDRLPAASPFHGAVEIEDYQLVPLHKALEMPRVNMMIADDVGLGKTVEAGLILSELLIRRRINRVLILTPASLRLQWRDELDSKFSLPFEVVDRDSTLKLKRSLGIDANPWRSNSRIIASYHYLRQPDILEEFLAASQVREGSATLPWDMLIVDEIHNLMPAPFGEDSQLCQMLRRIAPMFEHRLFLTATPHNGHTYSFTGLLEILDPVRFSQNSELGEAASKRVPQVVVRRLKREINERTDPPKFCRRMPPTAIPLTFSKEELRLIDAFDEFRAAVRQLMQDSTRKRRQAGNFALEILGKRLLSGPMTFLDSWQRCKSGLSESSLADDSEVITAVKAANEENADDRESEQNASMAAGVVGSWLKAFADDLAAEIHAIDAAAAALGVVMETRITAQDPQADARFTAICELLDSKLRDGKEWRKDERIVIFTEYKTTMDYLLRRLQERFKGNDDRFLQLFGGMDDNEREEVKERFSDLSDPARILIGTDAASEGLNLQATARYLLHYDCPWNPSRLEQRNGRLDRYGQLRDVYVHHFVSDQAADLKFMDLLIRKVEQIREDLGATGELFDEAIHKRLIDGESVEDVQLFLDANVETARKAVAIEADDNFVLSDDLKRKLQALKDELDLDPEASRLTLDAAMVHDANGSRPQLTEPDEKLLFNVVNPNLPGWAETIDESVRVGSERKLKGIMPRLTFSTECFKEVREGREIFIPRKDAALLHLSHPMMRKALTTLTRCRFPQFGQGREYSRWAVRLGGVPDGSDALIILHLEELAVNELRETFHHWISSICIPIKDGELQEALPHCPACLLGDSQACTDNSRKAAAQGMADEFEPELKLFIRERRARLAEMLQAQMESDLDKALKDAEARYQSRQGEISQLIQERTMNRLMQEIVRMRQQQQQGNLFHNKQDLDELEQKLERREEELRRMREQLEHSREQLAKERERVTKLLIPKRYTLSGEAQVFPVALEVRLPLQPGGAL
ncbi:MAG: DEAD/DEAH box helicase [Planctomycetales bacterium]|nr:DISARM system SNF2-like helicase DrmD [bacterium]UNM08182.1 MAG: DEAD/DEAH box helicase [Planctomycetales bacterium]